MPNLSIKHTVWGFRGSNGNEGSGISHSLPEQESFQEHPMQNLILKQQKQFSDLLNNQSKSLEDAVTEYRRRYGISPPPKFHVWYEFAQKRKVKLVDEFDSLHQMLTPFWALDPKSLRSRVKEAIGFKENNLLAVLIRDGRISFVQEANSTETEWIRENIVDMLGGFVHHLPDMDLAFNLHDEPRIVLPNDQLSRLLNIATAEMMRLSDSSLKLRNSFSFRPSDMNSGQAIENIRTSRFNRFSRQNSWSHSRISCPLDSPARFIGDSASDNTSSWAYGPLSFVRNTTALTDICLSPSLQNNHGFFERPNVFNIAQDLIPIFSESKVSSFQDILYPSPWYWARKTVYDPNTDIPFEKKNSTIYWRGSSTGGYSRKGGWRHQHRQRIVRTLNNPESSEKVLVHDVNQNGTWQEAALQSSLSSPSTLIDVSFTHIGQCDSSDCAAQREFFTVRDLEPQWNAWRSKLALDVDGNAFSGRFHALLSSRSAVVKMAVFREWWGEWIRPWVHYIPLSVQGHEWWEVIRWFLNDDEGLKAAEEIGMAGMQWSSTAFRKEDMQAWMFRLLLEYGRLIDDDRENIGFPGV
jgi:Glycosyl transferase family 90